MRGMLSVLEQQVAPGLPSDKRELISRVAHSVERMTGLLEAMLNLSRLEKKDPSVERYFHGPVGATRDIGTGSGSRA
jgi:signal transduction histidine kinase